MPSNKPAAGSTAIGNINDLPKRWAFSNQPPEEVLLNSNDINFYPCSVVVVKIITTI
jgi:hypothetical protein